MSVSLRERFEAHCQGHVFGFLDEGKLSGEEKQSLEEQLEKVDLDELDAIYAAFKKGDNGRIGGSENISPVHIAKDDENIEEWRRLGLKAIQRGEVAAVVLGGGQGTRLGFDGPKGMYSIGLPSKKTLYQLFAEKILKLQSFVKNREENQGDVMIPLFVMTSELNHEITRQYFDTNNYLGLKKEQVILFTQSLLPALDMNGKIIMQSRSKIVTAPCGNGGIFSALSRNKVMDKFTQFGVRYVHVFSVDNPLQRVCDPVFLGKLIEEGAEIGNKSLWKRAPEEKLGVLAKKNDKFCVVEYMELDNERRNMRTDDGKLVYGAGNICSHLFTIDFLRNKALPLSHLQYHVVKKEISCVTQQSHDVNVVEMLEKKCWGIKFELFIFDVFPLADKLTIHEINREEEFAPVKNAHGSPEGDSPDTSLSLYNNLMRKWVHNAGGVIKGDDSAIVEISALVSYCGEGLESFCAGKEFTSPCEII